MTRKDYPPDYQTGNETVTDSEFDTLAAIKKQKEALAKTK